MITRPPHALGGGADSQEYQVGGNFRLSEIAAALALVGIERFPAQAGQREEMASYMDENIFRAGPKVWMMLLPPSGRYKITPKI